MMQFTIIGYLVTIERANGDPLTETPPRSLGEWANKNKPRVHVEGKAKKEKKGRRNK